MDIFCEHMVKKKKDLKDILIISLWIFLGICLTAILGAAAIIFASSIVFSIYVALEIVVWYVVYILVTRRNIEYELALTNGDLEADAIYSKKRRVHLLSARVKDFEICAPISDARFKNQFTNLNGIKKIYSAHSNTSDSGIYFADFYYNAQKVRLIFEPSKEMIKKMKLYNEKNIQLEEGL